MKYFIVWLAATALALLLSILAIFPAVWHWNLKYYDFIETYRIRYLPWSFKHNRNRKHKPTTY